MGGVGGSLGGELLKSCTREPLLVRVWRRTLGRGGAHSEGSGERWRGRAGIGEQDGGDT